MYILEDNIETKSIKQVNIDYETNRADENTNEKCEKPKKVFPRSVEMKNNEKVYSKNSLEVLSEENSEFNE